MNAIAIRDDAKLIVEDIADDLRMALPATIPLDRFKATFITAVAHNPEILQCDVQSIKTSLMKAAADNLMPDNREAALVPFNTKVKGPNGKEEWKKLAQYMPMVSGIRKRALELGGARIHAECVYENDEFDAVLGDDPHISHKPAKFGKPRGEIIGAYAIFKDESGTILHRELMPKEDIESARKVSKSKDGPGWNNFYGEFARKTVVRRGAKSVPSISEKLRTIIERDDEYVDFTQLEKPRTIDHNPLLESNSTAAMETTEPSKAETTTESSSAVATPAADDGGDSVRTSHVEVAAANSSRTSPAQGAVEGARGSRARTTTDDAARANSSDASPSLPSDDTAAERHPQRSAASDHAMTAAELKKAASFLARQDSEEKLNKAASTIKAGSDTMTAPNDADLRLLAALKSKLAKVIESGEGGASDELDAFSAAVDDIFGLNDFPGDK
jgi:recombination protein RecT